MLGCRLPCGTGEFPLHELLNYYIIIINCIRQEAGGVLNKLETEVAAKLKVSQKSETDCRSGAETVKSSKAELKRLEKQLGLVSSV